MNDILSSTDFSSKQLYNNNAKILNSFSDKTSYKHNLTIKYLLCLTLITQLTTHSPHSVQHCWQFQSISRFLFKFIIFIASQIMTYYYIVCIQGIQGFKVYIISMQYIVELYYITL